MFEYALWRLWGALKTPLKASLKEKSSIVGKQFKALLSSTVDDLAGALQDGFFDTDTWRHAAEGRIRKKSGDGYGELLLSVTVFPIDAIAEATKVRKALVDRSGKNLRLDALRTDAGVDDQTGKNTLNDYAANVVRLGLKHALRRWPR